MRHLVDLVLVDNINNTTYIEKCINRSRVKDINVIKINNINDIGKAVRSGLAPIVVISYTGSLWAGDILDYALNNIYGGRMLSFASYRPSDASCIKKLLEAEYDEQGLFLLQHELLRHLNKGAWENHCSKAGHGKFGCLAFSRLDMNKISNFFNMYNELKDKIKCIILDESSPFVFNIYTGQIKEITNIRTGEKTFIKIVDVTIEPEPEHEEIEIHIFNDKSDELYSSGKKVKYSKKLKEGQTSEIAGWTKEGNVIKKLTYFKDDKNSILKDLSIE